MTNKIWNDLPHPADVRWEDSVLRIDMPTDLAEELEQITLEKYGVFIADMIRYYLFWIVEKPDEFKKWILQWKE